MRLLLVLFLATLPITQLNAQTSFQMAYQNHPLIPSGLLEAVAWTNTRMKHLNGQQESCSGYPQAFGIMGLHDNGMGYFHNNGMLVAQLSGITIADQKNSAENQIEAYAASVEALLNLQGVYSHVNGSNIRDVIHQLSEIPDTGIVNLMAKDMQAYEVFRFMENSERATQYGFTVHSYDLASTFGAANFEVLSSEQISISPQGITNDQGTGYSVTSHASLQYGPAIWDPAPSCNFSSRNGVNISAITIHTIQGTYAGAISWSQNCVSNVSFHYVIRSSDGQVTQMVLEEDKGWHVGTENPYTIGYEHEGYVDDPIWYTQAMYESSADLSRDIINSGYGIPAVRTYYGPSSITTDVLGGCTKIKGHQHYPNQTHTDPGIYWDWQKYYHLINNAPIFDTVSTVSGTLYDSGGVGGNYSDDERNFWLIQPPNTESITLNFTAFDLEVGYDNLFIYDGDSTDAPLLGQYTGANLPASITSSDGSILIEFRSDCATTAPGWAIDFTTIPLDVAPPTTSIIAGNTWQTQDFNVTFDDFDADSYIKERYYLIAEKDPMEVAPKANGTFGFANETFNDNATNWTDVTGVFAHQNDSYDFNDTLEQNSNCYMLVAQDAATEFLYEWTQTFVGTAQNQRAGMHFFCDNPNLSNRGNSYFIYLRANDDKVQIYSVDNDVYTLQVNNSFDIDEGIAYQCRVSYDPVTGWIRVFVDETFVAEWQDSTPLQSGISISLRTGGCEVSYDDIRVYKSRGAQVLVNAGAQGAMSIESESAVHSGFIYSLVTDSVDLWSTVASEQYLLDFSSPEIVFLNDGIGNDIDTVTNPTIEANWDALDIHSDIQEFEVAIGTLPLLDDVVAWNSNGVLASFSHILASPMYNEVYHVSVRAINGAGLSEMFVSDGQRYIDDLNLTDVIMEEIIVYPNPSNAYISLNNLDQPVQIFIYDTSGKICLEDNYTPEAKLNISHLPKATYNVLIQRGSEFIVKKLIVN